MSAHISNKFPEINWDDPIVVQAVKNASIRIWESKLIYGYWWFFCINKIFIGAPKTIPMDMFSAIIIDIQLCIGIPIWMDNSVPVP